MKQIYKYEHLQSASTMQHVLYIRIHTKSFDEPVVNVVFQQTLVALECMQHITPCHVSVLSMNNVVLCLECEHFALRVFDCDQRSRRNDAVQLFFQTEHKVAARREQGVAHIEHFVGKLVFQLFRRNAFSRYPHDFFFRHA